MNKVIADVGDDLYERHNKEVMWQRVTGAAWWATSD